MSGRETEQQTNKKFQQLIYTQRQQVCFEESVQRLQVLTTQLILLSVIPLHLQKTDLYNNS